MFPKYQHNFFEANMQLNIFQHKNVNSFFQYTKTNLICQETFLFQLKNQNYDLSEEKTLK